MSLLNINPMPAWVYLTVLALGILPCRSMTFNCFYILTDTIEKLLTDKGDIESELTKALHQARQSEKELKVDVFRKEAQLTELQQRLDAASVAGPAQLLVSSEW